MRLNQFLYEQPGSLSELVEVLTAYPPPESAIIAGGTDVLVKMGQRLKQPRRLISLKGLTAMRSISHNEGFVSIGPMVTLRELASSDLIKEKYPALAGSAAKAASPQIRNMGTLGGNLCLDNRCLYYNQQEWPGSFEPCYKRGGLRCYQAPRSKRCYAVFCADTPPALLAYDATLRVAGPQGERKVRAEEFYSDDGCNPLKLAAAEVITAIDLPLDPQRNSACRRFAQRGAIDFPLLGVAASWQSQNDRYIDIRIAATGLASMPLRLNPVEEVLRGREIAADNLALIDEALSVLKPVPQKAVPFSYRKQLLKQLVLSVLPGGEGGSTGGKYIGT